MTQLQQIKRYRQVLKIFVRYGFKEFIGQFGKGETFSDNDMERPPKFNDRYKEGGIRLRLAFEELGPAFIKIGQILSTRADILPESYIEELTKLQDNVSPIEATEAIKLIEEELSLKMEDIFAFFDETPMAIASIGQVHRAKLYNGDELVLKIKKVNIENQLELDLEILQRLARFLERKTAWGRIHKVTELAAELKNNILEELDYKNEGRNADRFSENFRDDPLIYIPRVYWKYTTRNVLCLEYQHGSQLNRILENRDDYFDRNLIADSIVDSYFNQIFVHGFFHGDPHPGNIIVLPDGKIMFVDFGAAGYINEELKNKFRFLLRSIITNRNSDVVDGVIDLGFAPAGVNRSELAGDINRLQGKYYHTPLDNIDLNEVLQEFVNISLKHNIHLPREFLLMIKTLGTLEGIVSRLNPGYRLINSLNKFGKVIKEDAIYNTTSQIKDLMFDYEKLLTRIPAQINKISDTVTAGEMKIKVELLNTDDPARNMGKNVNRLSLSILFASIIIAFALIVDRSDIVGILNYIYVSVTFTHFLMLIGASVILYWLTKIFNKKK